MAPTLTKKRSKPQNDGPRGSFRPLVLPIDIKQRVRTICAIMAGAFGVTLLCSLFLSTTALSLAVFGTLSLFMVIYSIIAIAIINTGQLKNAQIVILGLTYIIIGAAAMSVGEVVIEHNDDRARTGITGICIWIIIFPVFIPARPLHTFITATTAASLLPISYFIGQLFDLKTVSAGTLVDWFVPGYFCAALATVMSHQISHWSRALAEAQHEAEELGSYKLIEQLTEGGMGTIWKAQHKFLSQFVAVKFIRMKDGEEQADVDYYQFYQEADAIARLSSPYTISILDYGVSKNGSLYYTMEYINGFDLERLIGSYGPLSIDRCIHILFQICESLSEAHANGLIHRDIKPANIMVSMMGDTPDHVKVLDFGLVENVNFDSALPQAGTPGYMAPEIITGSAGASARSDIYAVACVAHWLLTAQELFSGANNEKILAAHLRKKPQSVSGIRPDCPEELSSMLTRCLAKNPEDRPSNISYLLKMLYDLQALYSWDRLSARTWWLGSQPIK